MRDFQKPERSQVFSSNGMIATSHPLAAKIGLDAMSKGGNAIDAAITSALMLVLCEPQSTGLFGDAFAIIKPNAVLNVGTTINHPRLFNNPLLNSGSLKAHI